MLKTGILTVRQIHQHRKWCQLAHLQSRGWDVENPEMVKIYNGKYVGEFKDNAHLVASIAEEFPKWERVNPGDPGDPISHSRVVQWNLLKIMKKIVDSGEPWLILEDDSYFETLRYEELCEHWENLKVMVGEENIRVAMLFWYDWHPRNPEGKHLDSFWRLGTRDAGQMANIYTPEGARYMLEDKGTSTHIETYLLKNPNVPGFFSSIKSEVNQDGFWNFDSISHLHTRGDFDHRDSLRAKLEQMYEGENL